MTSVGLALATWIRRVGRAVADERRDLRRDRVRLALAGAAG